MKNLKITIICLLALVGIGQLLLPSLAWDGGASAKIDVRVSDAATGAGISEAIVSLLYHGIPIKRTTTDAGGEALLYGTFPAGGSRTLLYRTTTLVTTQYLLRVERSGYITVEVPLATEGRVRGRKIRCRVELRRVGVTLEPSVSLLRNSPDGTNL
jgi:hypothetical protein